MPQEWMALKQVVLEIEQLRERDNTLSQIEDAAIEIVGTDYSNNAVQVLFDRIKDMIAAQLLVEMDLRDQVSEQYDLAMEVRQALINVLLANGAYSVIPKSTRELINENLQELIRDLVRKPFVFAIEVKNFLRKFFGTENLGEATTIAENKVFHGARALKYGLTIPTSKGSIPTVIDEIVKSVQKARDDSKEKNIRLNKAVSVLKGKEDNE